MKTICFGLLLMLTVVGGALAQTESLPLKLQSPDKAIEITVALGADNAPVYSVSNRNRPVLSNSALGLEFKTGGLLQKNLRVTNVRRASRDETYTLVAGKTKQARDNYNELIVSLAETAAPNRQLEIVFRAYNDGAAFRYRLPAQNSMQTIQIAHERSEFRFPSDYTCWAAQYNSFTGSQEIEFDRIPSSRIGVSNIVGLPLTCRTTDETTTFAIAEADLRDYAGMYFGGVGFGGYGVVSQLVPRPDDKTVAVRRTMTDEGVRTPWRVVMIANQPGKLIESTIITNLNPPTEIRDTSWIKPGKAAWDWWSGQLADNVSKAGMNNETMRHYIDFAAEMNLEYMLIDEGWYSSLPGYGDTMDFKADITKTIPEIDLPALIAYAKGKNVGIFVWTHWQLINDQMDKAFPFYEKLGIKGVKIDFMERDDQEMVEFYHRVMQKAAEHHLMINMHGAYKPTGLVRTYPNYITQEGVMGGEYNKWSARVTATHNLTLPFTRMLVGPMDYTPGGFRNVARPDFKISFKGPEVMTTRAQQLAMYVVYDSPLACVSDNPGAYRTGTGAEFLKTVPTSWDETRVMAGEIGEYVVIARRRGNEWYIGAMTNEQPREIEVPLEFLNGGNYDLIVYADGARPAEVATTNGKISAGKLNGANTLKLRLASGGGAAARLNAASVK